MYLHLSLCSVPYKCRQVLTRRGASLHHDGQFVLPLDVSKAPMHMWTASDDAGLNIHIF